MDNASYIDYLNVLRCEFVPAVGCTEPAAVALATATAAKYLTNNLVSIEIFVSPNIFKNALGVGIPGTGMVGLEIASAMGAIGGNAEAGLQVIGAVDSENIEKAKAFVEGGNVKVDIRYDSQKFFIEAVCRNAEECVTVQIIDRHSNICLIKKNETLIYQSKQTVDSKPDSYTIPEGISVANIYKFITTVPVESLYFLHEGVRLNSAISDEGLKGNYGLQMGKNIREDMELGILSRDLVNLALMRTTSASDARMAGSIMPVMSNCGSGNQGLTVSIPIITVAKELNASDERMLRALAMSLLIAIHMKSFVGKLSALCGVFHASAGSAAGIVYLLNGGLPEVEMAINNISGGVIGMICDGAKFGCSVKVGSGVSSAMHAAFLAMRGRMLDDLNGIIDNDVEKTIRNIGTLANDGMTITDEVILKTMIERLNAKRVS